MIESIRRYTIKWRCLFSSNDVIYWSCDENGVWHHQKHKKKGKPRITRKDGVKEKTGSTRTGGARCSGQRWRVLGTRRLKTVYNSDWRQYSTMSAQPEGINDDVIFVAFTRVQYTCLAVMYLWRHMCSINYAEASDLVWRTQI